SKGTESSSTVLEIPSGAWRKVKQANTACTRLVGVCAFLSSLRGLKLVPSKWRYLVPPTSG
ncbi:MAG TPA: hypothetical protein VKE92_11840, partial [Anaerolineales bacterium]|nr:hypothetical protein [Anaerolineales bacterium]